MIMRIENAFQFCGKLIHIYNEPLKGSVTGNTDLDNYILSSPVAPDTTDADVHALYTKPAVLKMEESRKSSRGFRKKPSNCQIMFISL
jgi:hypothetical protein